MLEFEGASCARARQEFRIECGTGLGRKERIERRRRTVVSRDSARCVGARARSRPFCSGSGFGCAWRLVVVADGMLVAVDV